MTLRRRPEELLPGRVRLPAQRGCADQAVHRRRCRADRSRVPHARAKPEARGGRSMFFPPYAASLKPSMAIGHRVQALSGGEREGRQWRGLLQEPVSKKKRGVQGRTTQCPGSSKVTARVAVCLVETRSKQNGSSGQACGIDPVAHASDALGALDAVFLGTLGCLHLYACLLFSLLLNRSWC